MKRVAYMEMDSDELDHLIGDHFGREYDSVADNEWNNGSHYVVTADGETFSFEFDGATRGDEYDIARWLAGESGFRRPNLNALLNRMVRDGALEPNTYLIEVYW